MSDQPVLVTHNLTKEYAPGAGAIDVSISLNASEIVGFIGPNGAGKTTTIRMLMGFVAAERGQLEIYGQSLRKSDDWLQVLGRIGYMSGEVSFYPNSTVSEILNYAASLYGHKYRERAHELAKSLDLNLKAKFKDLSLGNRKKVGVVNALIQKPDMLIWDEPTSGLDPLVQQTVLGLLKEVRSDGGTVFLSSHVLSEVQQVCDRIVMIKSGRIILQDRTSNILARAQRALKIDHLDAGVRSQLSQLAGVSQVQHAGATTTVLTANPQPVIELLVRAGRFDFFIEQTSLEDMFMDQYKVN